MEIKPSYNIRDFVGGQYQYVSFLTLSFPKAVQLHQNTAAGGTQYRPEGYFLVPTFLPAAGDRHPAAAQQQRSSAVTLQLGRDGPPL